MSETAEEAIERIKNTKDFYKTLGLEKGCDESAIKKSYRKLALLLHPGIKLEFSLLFNDLLLITRRNPTATTDKCGVEGAEEVIKNKATVLLILSNKTMLCIQSKAFKSVGEAYKCLSSADTRRTYDLTGSNNDNGVGSGAFDADELFAQMFARQRGGGFAFQEGSTPFQAFHAGRGGNVFTFHMGGGMPGQFPFRRGPFGILIL